MKMLISKINTSKNLTFEVFKQVPRYFQLLNDEFPHKKNSGKLNLQIIIANFYFL